MARSAAPGTALTIGGAAVAAAGLLLLIRALHADGLGALLPLSAVLLALGCGVLGVLGTVTRSRLGRIALVVTGLGPLLFLVPVVGTPVPGLVVGMTLTWLVALATVAAAVEIARTGRVRAVARWGLLVVAADALVVALMSTVPVEALWTAYLGAHLELVRPIALLVWGAAVALDGHLPAIGRRLDDLDAAWKASTRVGDPPSRGASRID